MWAYRIFISNWDWGQQITIIHINAICYLRFHINKEETSIAHFSIVEVANNYRRCGYCKSIWNIAESEARKLGCSTIIGYAKEDNIAFKWYLKIGMQIEGNKDKNDYYKLVKQLF